MKVLHSCSTAETSDVLVSLSQSISSWARSAAFLSSAKVCGSFMIIFDLNLGSKPFTTHLTLKHSLSSVPKLALSARCMKFIALSPGF